MRPRRLLSMSMRLLPNAAAITLRGRIGRSLRPGDVEAQLRLARRLPFVRGLLLRIDSPGGDAADSEEMRASISRVAEQMPVVAHIRRVGASGAYLVAAEANEIVATKWAAVGSIGVILLRPNVTDLLERVGVDVYVRKSGRFKDLGLPFRRPTAEDEQKDGELIGRLFDDFVRTVSEARDLDAAAVEQLATGEVFLGSRAAELNLVDHVGDEQSAKDRLADLMGESASRCVELRVPTGIFGRMRPAAALELLGPFAALTGRPRLETLSMWARG